MPRLWEQKHKQVLLVTRFVFCTLICLVAQHRLSGSLDKCVHLLGCVYCGCGKSVTCVLNPLLTTVHSTWNDSGRQLGACSVVISPQRSVGLWERVEGRGGITNCLGNLPA